MVWNINASCFLFLRSTFIIVLDVDVSVLSISFAENRRKIFFFFRFSKLSINRNCNRKNFGYQLIKANRIGRTGYLSFTISVAKPMSEWQHNNEISESEPPKKMVKNFHEIQTKSVFEWGRTRPKRIVIANCVVFHRVQGLNFFGVSLTYFSLVAYGEFHRAISFSLFKR